MKTKMYRLICQRESQMNIQYNAAFRRKRTKKRKIWHIYCILSVCFCMAIENVNVLIFFFKIRKFK